MECLTTLLPHCSLLFSSFLPLSYSTSLPSACLVLTVNPMKHPSLQWAVDHYFYTQTLLSKSPPTCTWVSMQYKELLRTSSCSLFSAMQKIKTEVTEYLVPVQIKEDRSPNVLVVHSGVAYAPINVMPPPGQMKGYSGDLTSPCYQIPHYRGKLCSQISPLLSNFSFIYRVKPIIRTSNLLI